MGCKHPNLEQEIRQSGVSLHTLAEHANVTQEIMHDVLRGTDTLTIEEAGGLYRLFASYSIPNDSYSFQYLFSQTLTMAAPNQREQLLQVADTHLPQIRGREREVEAIKASIDRIRICPVIPYAQYRHLMFDINLLHAVTREKTVRSKHLEEI